MIKFASRKHKVTVSRQAKNLKGTGVYDEEKCWNSKELLYSQKAKQDPGSLDKEWKGVRLISPFFFFYSTVICLKICV